MSPGVFTRENDLSGLAQGVADIGGVIVAPFPKGPGFAPTLVTSVSELEEKFGTADGVYYGPYTAKEYLSEQGRVTVCRVGALTGYKQENPLMVYAIPGVWDRIEVSASVETGSADDYSFVKDSEGSTTVSDVLTYDSASTSVTMSSVTVVVTFEDDTATFYPAGSGSGDYAGETVTLGTFNLTTGSGVYITSSYQGDPTKTSAQKF